MSSTFSSVSRWVEALRLSARGQSDEAARLVAIELRLSLCRPAKYDASEAYLGPLPMAVAHFASRLDATQFRLLKSLEVEFIEALLDDSLSGITHTIRLVEYCHAQPTLSFEQLVGRFPWWPGLKRGLAWKEEWIANHIRSFTNHQIPIPPEVILAVGDRGEMHYEYNEVAWAVAPERLRLTWQDFVHEQGPMASPLQLVDEHLIDEISAESLDYRAIPVAGMVGRLVTETGIEMLLDLERVSTTVSRDINLALEDLHTTNPLDGYRPVAWHNVFWSLQDQYDQLQLNLELHEPELGTDVKLLDHLLCHHPEIGPISRPTLSRRRNHLNLMCQDLIIKGLRVLFSSEVEQRPFGFTQRDREER